MKPDLLTAEVMTDSYRQYCADQLNHPARRMSREVRQFARPATAPPHYLNERRILHDLSRQNPGLESRSKDHEGDRKAIVLQKRG